MIHCKHEDTLDPSDSRAEAMKRRFKMSPKEVRSLEGLRDHVRANRLRNRPDDLKRYKVNLCQDSGHRYKECKQSFMCQKAHGWHELLYFRRQVDCKHGNACRDLLDCEYKHDLADLRAESERRKVLKRAAKAKKAAKEAENLPKTNSVDAGSASNEAGPGASAGTREIPGAASRLLKRPRHETHGASAPVETPSVPYLQASTAERGRPTVPSAAATKSRFSGAARTGRVPPLPADMPGLTPAAPDGIDRRQQGRSRADHRVEPHKRVNPSERLPDAALSGVGDAPAAPFSRSGYERPLPNHRDRAPNSASPLAPDELAQVACYSAEDASRREHEMHRKQSLDGGLEVYARDQNSYSAGGSPHADPYGQDGASYGNVAPKLASPLAAGDFARVVRDGAQNVPRHHDEMHRSFDGEDIYCRDQNALSVCGTEGQVDSYGFGQEVAKTVRSYGDVVPPSDSQWASGDLTRAVRDVAGMASHQNDEIRRKRSFDDIDASGRDKKTSSTGGTAHADPYGQAVAETVGSYGEAVSRQASTLASVDLTRAVCDPVDGASGQKLELRGDKAFVADGHGRDRKESFAGSVARADPHGYGVAKTGIPATTFAGAAARLPHHPDTVENNSDPRRNQWMSAPTANAWSQDETKPTPPESAAQNYRSMKPYGAPVPPEHLPYGSHNRAVTTYRAPHDSTPALRSEEKAAVVATAPTQPGTDATFWRACSSLFLSKTASPADVLAFKILRDVILCPVTGLGRERVAKVSDVFARIPQPEVDGEYSIQNIPRGGEPVQSAEERAAIRDMWEHVDGTFEAAVMRRRRQDRLEKGEELHAVWNDPLYRKLCGMPGYDDEEAQDAAEIAETMPPSPAAAGSAPQNSGT
jgi:hypothetical protein